MSLSVIGLIPRHLYHKRVSVKVAQCWNGGNKYSFRLTMPDGSRESIGGQDWTRKVARTALDLLQNVYGYERRKVRFRHV